MPEGALTANEELLRQFIKHTPAAIAMFDNEMRYLQVSDRFLTDYHSTGTKLNRQIHYQVFPEIPERWKEIHRRVLAGAVERCDEDPLTSRDGSVEWLQWEVIPWRNAAGEIGGMILFSQVITERKRAEEKLRWSEQQLRLLLDSTAEGIFGVDLEGRCTFCNAASLRLLGYEAVAEMLGADMHELIAHSRVDGSPYPKEECSGAQSDEWRYRP